LSNQPKPPDFSDVPTDATPQMYSIGEEGQTPADVVSIILGNKDFKDDPELQVLLRTNWTAEECTILMRVLTRARYGLMADGQVPKEWQMPWLKHAVIFLAASRCSTDFHSVNKSVDALTAMRPKTEQTIKMSSV
jgi:hypothetical protein